MLYDTRVGPPGSLGWAQFAVPSLRVALKTKGRLPSALLARQSRAPLFVASNSANGLIIIFALCLHCEVESRVECRRPARQLARSPLKAAHRASMTPHEKLLIADKEHLD